MIAWSMGFNVPPSLFTIVCLGIEIVSLKCNEHAFLKTKTMYIIHKCVFSIYDHVSLNSNFKWKSSYPADVIMTHGHGLDTKV